MASALEPRPEPRRIIRIGRAHYRPDACSAGKPHPQRRNFNAKPRGRKVGEFKREAMKLGKEAGSGSGSGLRNFPSLLLQLRLPVSAPSPLRAFALKVRVCRLSEKLLRLLEEPFRSRLGGVAAYAG